MRAAARTETGKLFSPVRWWTNRQLPAIFCWNIIFSGHGIEIFQCYTLVSTHTHVAFSALRAYKMCLSQRV
jgi:hypothetical protein